MQRIYGDWATKGTTDRYIALAWDSLSPFLRAAFAIFVIWSVAGFQAPKGSNSNVDGGGSAGRSPRLLCASLVSIWGAFLTYSYLLPMFHPAADVANVYDSPDNDRNGDMNLATVALLILSLTAAFVSAALGSLLPRPFSGATLGVGIALAVGATLASIQGAVNGGTRMMSGPLGFPILGGVLGLLGGMLSTR